MNAFVLIKMLSGLEVKFRLLTKTKLLLFDINMHRIKENKHATDIIKSNDFAKSKTTVEG